MCVNPGGPTSWDMGAVRYFFDPCRVESALRRECGDELVSEALLGGEQLLGEVEPEGDGFLGGGQRLDARDVELGKAGGDDALDGLGPGADAVEHRGLRGFDRLQNLLLGGGAE